MASDTAACTLSAGQASQLTQYHYAALLLFSCVLLRYHTAYKDIDLGWIIQKVCQIVITITKGQVGWIKI